MAGVGAEGWDGGAGAETRDRGAAREAEKAEVEEV